MVIRNATASLGYAMSYFATGDYKVINSYYASTVERSIGELQLIGIITTTHRDSFG